MNATMSPEVLDTAAAVPAIASEKRRAVDVLAPGRGDRVLDVGCGLAADLEALAPLVLPGGGAYGADLDPAMLGEAASRRKESDAVVHLACAAGDGLPYPDGVFDAVRAERVLQHVEDPSRVVAEMERVLRPGGRLYISDTDWSTATLSCLPARLLRALEDFLEQWVPSPRAGSQLVGIVTEAGLANVDVTAVTVVSRKPSLPPFSHCGSLYGLNPKDVEEVSRLTEAAAAAGTLVGSVTMFVVSATKPAT